MGRVWPDDRRTMPKAQPPKPLPQKVTRARSVQTTVIQQSEFTGAAIGLATKLGWEGEAHWLANDITVRDAQRYLVKILHESFEACAKGLPAPSAEAAAKHLGIKDAAELKILGEAMSLAFEAGKDQPLATAALKRASMDVEMSGNALSMLNKLLAAEAEGAK